MDFKSQSRFFDYERIGLDVITEKDKKELEEIDNKDDFDENYYLNW